MIVVKNGYEITNEKYAKDEKQEPAMVFLSVVSQQASRSIEGALV